jgi:hypothetical protein
VPAGQARDDMPHVRRGARAFEPQRSSLTPQRPGQRRQRSESGAAGQDGHAHGGGLAHVVVGDARMRQGHRGAQHDNSARDDQPSAAPPQPRSCLREHVARQPTTRRNDRSFESLASPPDAQTRRSPRDRGSDAGLQLLRRGRADDVADDGAVAAQEEGLRNAVYAPPTCCSPEPSSSCGNERRRECASSSACRAGCALATPSIRRPCPASRAARSSRGASCRHGLHSPVQKLMTTGIPRSSVSATRPSHATRHQRPGAAARSPAVRTATSKSGAGVGRPFETASCIASAGAPVSDPEHEDRRQGCEEERQRDACPHRWASSPRRSIRQAGHDRRR